MTTNGESPRTGLTLAIIGCGTMGSAILTGVISASNTASISKSQSQSQELGQSERPKISHFIATVSAPSSATALRARFSSHSSQLTILQGEDANVSAMQLADIILLSFKPYMISSILSQPGIRSAVLSSSKLIISVLVGSPISKISDAILQKAPLDRLKGEKLCIKRAMMNIAAEFSASMTVIESSPPELNMPEEYEELTSYIFIQLGKIHSVPPELYDVSGVLAGASGALFSVAFDGMLDGAVSQGLKRSDGKTILTQALFSLATLLEKGEHPAVLREKFSSPKGTTIDGLLSLEEDRARWAFSRAVIASSKRSWEIGK